MEFSKAPRTRSLYRALPSKVYYTFEDLDLVFEQFAKIERTLQQRITDLENQQCLNEATVQSLLESCSSGNPLDMMTNGQGNPSAELPDKS